MQYFDKVTNVAVSGNAWSIFKDNGTVESGWLVHIDEDLIPLNIHQLRIMIQKERNHREEKIAWLTLAIMWEYAARDPFSVYGIQGCAGLCPLIHRLKISEDTKDKVLAKIAKLPPFKEGEQFKWSHLTEEGKAARITFCRQQAETL